MSFDLCFLPRRGKSLPALDALSGWAKSHGHFEVNNDKLVYNNAATGVYFTLDRSNESLLLNLNYCRASFFALECFDVLTYLAKRFPLDISDSQGIDEPHPFEADELIASWKKGNQFACSATRQLKNHLLYLDETRSTELWRYLHAYPRLKEKYDEMFVPEVLVVERDGVVLRGAHLTRPTSYVWPPVDVFWLQNYGIVQANRVLEVLSKYLTKMDQEPWLREVSESTIFDTDVKDVWESMYDKWMPEFQLKDVSSVSLDGFVDAAP